MKTIVISGASSNVGKTTLARELSALLPGAVIVKIGHHPRNPVKHNVYYPRGTTFSEIALRHKQARTLIIESNSVLGEMTPDCAIYLTGDSPKPSAVKAEEKADMIRGRRIGKAKIAGLARRLGLGVRAMRKVAWLSGARPSSVTAVILAGGKSERMGADKASLEINGVPLVRRLRVMLKPWFDRVLVSAPAGSKRKVGLEAVADRYAGCGPLAGIHACLSRSKTEMNFVISCDVPEVNLPVIFKLFSLSEDNDIVAPSFRQGFREPLFACYRKRVARVARRRIEKGLFSVNGLLDECKAHVLPLSGESWYRNLNTPEDYRRFLSHSRGIKPKGASS